MGEETKIDWCDSTFSPWIGCSKVSAGCDNCYAEAMFDKRLGIAQWGPHGERVSTSRANWNQPRKWERQHELFFAQHQRKRRVFCASLTDVFDNKAPPLARADLWTLIETTPNLDWLLLTKRPENIRKYIPSAWMVEPYWPRNIWLGVTCEDQSAFDKRWPILQSIPAAVRFISYEPAIGPLQFAPDDVEGLHWLICGGESGHGYRGMPELWADDARTMCNGAGVAFFLKQMAGKRKIPEYLLTREFPQVAA